ncbi:DUF5979 domain-containing protein [Microbacterium immunditiarum]|uniref:DUF5979 domain-containing protein n=1 Tax=Microbacterium immunditiarum TaxID=337480 RepID=UPI001C534C7A
MAECAELAIQGSCTIAYDELGPDGYVDVIVPSSVTSLTILAYGAEGGGTGDDSGRGGPGGLVVAVYERPATASGVRVWLGEKGRQSHETTKGYSSGGGGGTRAFDSSSGFSGGGSSALAWLLPSGPQLAIVAGGGGGASQDGDEGGAASGGAGGAPPSSGTAGTTPASNGNGQGGAGGGASGAGGETGSDAGADYLISSGGGGGGGGHPRGGAAGESGSAGQCKINGKCPPNAQGGAGGGGGGGDSWSDSQHRVNVAYASGSSGDGSVLLIAGEQLHKFECIDSSDPRTWSIPADTASIAFVVAGGGGTRGHNNSDMEGSGAVVTGIIDATGMEDLRYWVGCSGYEHGGRGWSHPGGAGSASSKEAKDGGAGGGASMLMDATGGAATPLVAAGGGGGSGGNVSTSLVPFASEAVGGRGGSGAGVDGGAYNYNGDRGAGDDFGHGGVGGCAACRGTPSEPDPSGGDGTSDDSGGGGGGGGAGYPRGGHGGGTADVRAGGGGGAGQSYWSAAVTSEVSAGPNGIRSRSGFIILVPIPKPPSTSLTVTKEVSGAASGFARGPYTVELTCTLDGVTIADESFTIGIGPSAGHTVEGLPVDSICTVTETGKADAPIPPPPRTVTLTSAPASVVLDNAYAMTAVEIGVTSAFAQHDGPTPGDLPLGEVDVGISCSLDGVPVPLGPPVVDGRIPFDGAATWNAEVSATVSGVPVNSECTLTHTGGPGATTMFTLGSQTVTGSSFVFTAAADAMANVVAIDDEYGLAPLTVTNEAEGSGTPPVTTYSVSVVCAYAGEGVTLDPSQATIVLPSGGATTVPNLPVGADCTTTQLDPGIAAAVRYSPSQTVPIPPGGGSQTIVDVFEAGGLVLVKQLTGPGARWANASTTVSLTCTADGLPDPVVELEHTFGTLGGSFTVTGLDVGDECSMTETVTGGASAVSYSSSSDPAPSPDPVSVEVGDSATSLTVLNRFDVGSLVVDSRPEGPAAHHARPTAVTVGECTFNGLPIEVEPGRATVEFPFPADGGHARVPAIVAGAACDVVQTASGGAAFTEITVTDGDPFAPIDSGTQVTVHGAGASPTTVSIVNEFEAGALSVPVDLDGAAAWAANADYGVELHCEFDDRPAEWLGPDGIGFLSFAPDGTPRPTYASTQLSDLPTGTVCEAIQVASGGATFVTYDPAPISAIASAAFVAPAADIMPFQLVDGGSGPVTVESGTTVSITITNTFEAGTLAVATEVGGNDAAAHADAFFLLEQFCTFNGQRLGPPPDDPTRPVHFSLTGTAERTFDELPVGAECTAAETDSSNATLVTPATTQSGTIQATGLRLAFTNLFDVTGLTVRQVMTGPGVATYGTGLDYSSVVECWTGPDRTQRVDVPNDGVAVLTPAGGYSLVWTLPANAVCSITENSVSLATEVTGSPAVTLLLGEPHLLEVTREFELATFTVDKRVVGGASASVFDFAVGCTWTRTDPIPVPLNGDAPPSFSLSSGGSVQRQVIGGADCTVTEAPAGSDVRTSVSVAGETIAGRTAATLLLAGDSAAFAYTNAYPLPPTGLAVPMLALRLGLLLGALGIGILLLRARRANAG